MAKPEIAIQNIIVSLLSPDIKKFLPIKYTDTYGITLHIIPITERHRLNTKNSFPSSE